VKAAFPFLRMKKGKLFDAVQGRGSKRLLVPAFALGGALIAVVPACGPGTDSVDADSGASGANGSGGSDGDGGSGGSNNGACAEGTFDHDDDRSTTCQSWSTCQPGLYVSNEGTATTDRECHACRTGTYSVEQNSETCFDWTDCEAGEYVLIEGDEASNRDCDVCEAGTFSAEENAEECEPWLECEPGEFVEAEPEASSDRTCTPCAAGHFSEEGNASACAPWTDCGHPWMTDTPGTAVSDATCQSGIRQLDGVSGEYFSIAADADGNAFITGETTGDLDGANVGGTDAFVRKYDATGMADWTRQIGTAGDEVRPVVAVDGYGRIVVAGATSGEFEGDDVFEGLDAFVRSFSPEGSPGAARRIDTAEWENVRQLSFDALDRPLLAGFQQTPIGSDPGNAAFKYRVNESTVTLNDGDALLTSGAQAASVDDDGGFYMAGYTTGTNLDGTGAGGIDAFVSKYDSLGALGWIRQFGTTDSDGAYAVCADGDGNVFVAGNTQGDIDDDNTTGGSGFVRMYDALGDPIWTREFAGPEEVRPHALYVDDDGNLLVAGGTDGVLEGEGAGGEDAFVRMYDPTGEVIWTQQFGTALDDAAQSVTINAAGHIFVAGRLADALTTTGAFVAGVVPP